jgi:hypothetical protein
MYWIWANERSDESELRIDNVPPIIDANDWNFDNGERIGMPLPVIDIPFTMRADDRLTDNLVVPGCRGLLVNTRLKAILDELGIENLQYFDTRLQNQNDQKVSDDYYLVNIIGRLSCIDMNASELELDADGEIEFINSLALRPELSESPLKIFRDERFQSLIVAHESIKDALGEQKISGIRFYRPEVYSL